MAVFKGWKEKTPGGLTRGDLFYDPCTDKVKSKRRAVVQKERFAQGKGWAFAMTKARDEFVAEGKLVVRQHLYVRAKQIMKN